MKAMKTRHQQALEKKPLSKRKTESETSPRQKRFKGDENSQSARSSAVQHEKIEASTSASKTSKEQEVLSKEELMQRFTVRQKNLRQNNIIGSTSVFKKLCDSFETSRDPERGQAMCKYMRNKFEFFGIQAPRRREISKPLWKEMKTLSSSDLRTLMCEVWYSPEREFQQFATDLFEREILRIYLDDGLNLEDYVHSTLDFVRQFLSSSKSWWDTVDPLASKVVGPLVKKYPDHLLPVMDEWNVSGVTWLVRTSIIYQLGYGRDTDAPRLFRYCLKVAHEDEFFIQKAIGWALRQHYRVDPQAVKTFVTRHKKKLSALSVREALKHDK
ncbi:DNA alkylation repair protein [Plakobranchus ocellatus]|uniref:DNA alkylation repair protein n=1 Tax=Plakobranchus ocellatus TaxID=259542 RepID=A0AAV4DXY6_9GAST|nr:DNA alkylation repair protein [Plakobranchus ocellatus]